jgi:hypothetical protein
VIINPYLYRTRITAIKHLIPPSLCVSTEVSLRPGAEKDLSGCLISIDVSQGKRKRGRSTDNGTSGGVLRSMAGAHELVLGSSPGYNATQVSAYSVQTICLESLIILHNQVTVNRLKMKAWILLVKKKRGGYMEFSVTWTGPNHQLSFVA